RAAALAHLPVAAAAARLVERGPETQLHVRIGHARIISAARCATRASPGTSRDVVHVSSAPDERMNFLSDNNAPACPQLMAALDAANRAPAPAYGADAWTQQLDAAFGRVFDHDVRAFPVATGTAANALGLGALLEPWSAALAHEDAHIVADECGA